MDLENSDLQLIKKYLYIAGKALADIALQADNYGINATFIENSRENFELTKVFSEYVLGLRPEELIDYLTNRGKSQRATVCKTHHDLSVGFSPSPPCDCVLCKNIAELKSVVDDIKREYPYTITSEKNTELKHYRNTVNFKYRLARIISDREPRLFDNTQQIEVLGYGEISGEYQIIVYEKYKNMVIRWGYHKEGN